MWKRIRRSASTFARMPGRRILSTTGVPSCSFARWTCAIDAEPNGRGSSSRNTSKGERPSARSSSGRSASNGTGGTSLCSFSNSAIQLGGKRSTRVAITCPSLMNVGPSSSSAMRTRCAGSRRTLSFRAPQFRICPARSSTPATPMRRTMSPSPWRMKTDVISCRRGRSRMTLTVSRSTSRLLGLFLLLRRRRAQRFREPAEDAARDHREPPAELVRRLEAGDRRVDRGGGEFLGEVAHRERDLLAGLRPGAARGAERVPHPRLHALARGVAHLPDGREEVVLELAQVRERLLELGVREVFSARRQLLQRRVPRFGRGPQRLVESLQRLGHREAHVGPALLGAERDALGDRPDDLAHAVTVEALPLQREQRELLHLGADIGPLADGLARRGLDPLAGEIVGRLWLGHVSSRWQVATGAYLSPVRR